MSQGSSFIGGDRGSRQQHRPRIVVFHVLHWVWLQENNRGGCVLGEQMDIRWKTQSLGILAGPPHSCGLEEGAIHLTREQRSLKHTLSPPSPPPTLPSLLTNTKLEEVLLVWSWVLMKKTTSNLERSIQEQIFDESSALGRQTLKLWFFHRTKEGLAILKHLQNIQEAKLIWDEKNMSLIINGKRLSRIAGDSGCCAKLIL